MKPILFTLANCPKCEATKEYLKDIDYELYIFPYTFIHWAKLDIKIAKKYDILEDLQKTAPVLVVDEKKIIGLLRIKKWAMK